MGGGDRHGHGRVERPPPLHTSCVEQPIATINRLQILSHFVATLALLYYRASTISKLVLHSVSTFEILAWVLILGAELILMFLWILCQGYRWRPVSRTPFPERLPEDDGLTPIDIFICTADHEKEPTMEVMNTLISSMCLDYPVDKLHVYLSDDGGSPVTLHATKHAYAFARSWLPFCRRYKIGTICPEAYFSSSVEMISQAGDGSFFEEHERIQHMYEDLKEKVKKETHTAMSDQDSTKKGGDRPSHIEIIEDSLENNTLLGVQEKMPLLVYVSREKRNRFPHHYKAGALNVMLRVSSTLSNSPCILVLDCDMYANDPASARQAMCFHLDPHISPSLAFVQFPQCFHNISKNDIYSAQMRSYFKILWKGCDGLRGPILSGTCFYIKRDALYGVKPGLTSIEEFRSIGITELKSSFGDSNEFITSLRQNYKSKSIPTTLPLEATLVASCEFEIDTQWGEQVGFLYGSVVEDYFTGFHLHCRGWISTYYYPSKPAFLGSVPISFPDTMVQNKRWMSGLLQVAFSKFCPLTYGWSSKMSLLQIMCYAWPAFIPLYSIALLVYGTIPQLCFSKGIRLFPPVSSPWFIVFGIVYASSLCQHLMEVFLSGGSFTMWWNEMRFWMVISVTAYFFACLNMAMKLMGLGEVNFDVTNKVVGDKQIQMYKNGVFDFEGSSLLLVPATTLAILNLSTFLGGARRLIFVGNLGEMFAQFFLSVVVLIISYPILEGIIIRRDKGRVPFAITWWSVVLAGLLHLVFG